MGVYVGELMSGAQIEIVISTGVVEINGIQISNEELKYVFSLNSNSYLINEFISTSTRVNEILLQTHRRTSSSMN